MIFTWCCLSWILVRDEGISNFKEVVEVAPKLAGNEVAHSDLRIESVRTVRCYPAKTNLYPTTSVFLDTSRIEFVRIEFTYRIRQTP